MTRPSEPSPVLPSTLPPPAQLQNGPPPRPSAPALSTKALELARGFLSSLFMGVRTAQIHDPGNKAFENAVFQVRDAAQALFAATGGFAVQFVEESVFLNGHRVRLEGGVYDSVRKLRGVLESQGMGGVELASVPTAPAIRSLLLGFSPAAQLHESLKRELAAQQLNILGIQRFADGAKAGLKIDRRIFAAQCYAKLILAFREQVERAQDETAIGGRGPRLRAVRVIQDMVELCADRVDFLLRLTMNRNGAEAEALAAANTCMLAISLGHALGICRQDLVDIGVAALFHNLGRALGESSPRVAARASFAKLLGSGVRGSNGNLRAMIAAEQGTAAGEALPWGGARPRPHLFSRIVGVASAWAGLVLGVDPTRHAPLGSVVALEVISRDQTGRWDPRLVDLAINLFRAFPVGVEVRLDTGQHGLVTAAPPESRWDRPIVTLEGSAPRTLDLMAKEGGRFVARVEETVYPPTGLAARLELPAEPLPDSAISTTGDLAASEMLFREPTQDLLELASEEEPILVKPVEGEGDGATPLDLDLSLVIANAEPESVLMRPELAPLPIPPRPDSAALAAPPLLDSSWKPPEPADEAQPWTDVQSPTPPDEATQVAYRTPNFIADLNLTPPPIAPSPAVPARTGTTPIPPGSTAVDRTGSFVATPRPRPTPPPSDPSRTRSLRPSPAAPPPPRRHRHRPSMPPVTEALPRDAAGPAAVSPTDRVLERYQVVGVVVGQSEPAHLGRRADGLPVWLVRVSWPALDKDEVARDLAVLSRLSHPALPRLVEGAVDSAQAVFVFEAIEGTSLAQLMEVPGRLNRESLRRIIRSIAEAAQQLLAIGVRCPELTPERVRVGPGDQAVLVALGQLEASGDGDLAKAQAGLGALLKQLLELLRGGDPRLGALAERLTGEGPRFASMEDVAIALTRP